MVKEGYGVITGGGPGIMEAGNRGAHLEKGASIGLNIDLPFETSSNPFVDHDKDIDFRYFFIRKVMFVKLRSGFHLLSGRLWYHGRAIRSADFDSNRKISQVPVMLVGTDYWSGMKQWIQETMAEKEKTHFC